MTSVRNVKYIKAFGKHLREVRLSQNLTCEKLEELTGIDAKQISRLERGERSPTISTIYTLSKGMDIEPEVLFKFEFKE
jgi:transcriptional regulator with XRE-family HTH domain